MADFEHYELWAEKKGQWGKVASFREFDLASTVLRNYKYRMRLVRVSYQGGEPVLNEVLVEVGATRREP
jgi:sulfatase maturation enzyme AslB (radical SAM superfamily)